MAEEHDGASVKEQLVHACRSNNLEILNEIIASYSGKPDQLAQLLNSTTSVLGNHLYHEAALKGNDEVIELLLDQEGFECDPINRAEGDTPLHSAIRWVNAEPPAQREFGSYLVNLMLEAGSDPTVRNRAKLTAYQLADPSNPELRDLIRRHEELNQQEAAQAAYVRQNAGDFIQTDGNGEGGARGGQYDEDDDDDAEFSGSDDEERAEFERRKRERKAKR